MVIRLTDIPCHLCISTDKLQFISIYFLIIPHILLYIYKHYSVKMFINFKKRSMVEIAGNPCQLVKTVPLTSSITWLLDTLFLQRLRGKQLEIITVLYFTDFLCDFYKVRRLILLIQSSFLL